MKALKSPLYAAGALVILALSAILFMWGTLFLCPLFLVLVVFIAIKGPGFLQIHRPARKDLPWKA